MKLHRQQQHAEECMQLYLYPQISCVCGPVMPEPMSIALLQVVVT